MQDVNEMHFGECPSENTSIIQNNDHSGEDKDSQHPISEQDDSEVVEEAEEEAFQSAERGMSGEEEEVWTNHTKAVVKVALRVGLAE